MLQTKKQGINHCPIENVDYIGTCPVVSCPANLSRLTKNMNNGCYFCLSNKTDLSSLATNLDITMKKINSDYATGIRELERVVIPIANLVDEEGCPECGWRDCKGGNDCKERNKAATKSLSKYPLNIEEFDITKNKVWQLAKMQSKNEELSIVDENIMKVYKKFEP